MSDTKPNHVNLDEAAEAAGLLGGGAKVTVDTAITFALVLLNSTLPKADRVGGLVHAAMQADGWTKDMIGAAMDAASLRRPDGA